MAWLFPSLIAASAAALLVGLIYCYLFHQERKRYLLLWGYSWLLYSSRFLIQLAFIHNPEYRQLVAVQQVVSLAGGYFFVLGAYLFWQRNLPRPWTAGFALCAVWSVAALGRTSFLLYNVPTDFLIGAAYIWTGVLLLRLEQHRGVGLYTASWSLVLWGVHKADYAFLRPFEWFAPWGFLLAAVLFLSSSLGILLLYYEKVRAGFQEQIRARERTEKSLRESQRNYRRIVETANEGVAAMDAAMRLTFVNQKMAGMLGYAPEELMGRDPSELVHPEDLMGHERTLEQRRQGRSGSYERRFLRKDGQVIWCLVSGAPLLDDQGAFAGAFAMLTDITQRKQMEEDLRESRRFLAELIEHSGALVFVKDRQGRYELINRKWEEVTGLKREGVLGRTDEDLFPGEIGRQFRANDLEAMAAGGVVEKEEVLDDASGRRYFISIKFPLLGTEGQVRGICGMTTEITERKQAEEQRRTMEQQLRQAQKMEAVGTLAGGIAHDFNNILTAVLGFAEMAREDAEEGRANPADLDQIINSAQRAKTLVQQILAFSRKTQAHLEPLDLNQAVLSARGILERTLPKMIAIETRLAPAVPPVLADPNQLQQVLLNLASNASDAMPEGGRLGLETGLAVLDHEYCRQHLEVRPGTYAMLSVSDTGQGMDAQTRGHVFEPFFTTKEVGKGTGLGLSSAYGIIKNHGGHIHCYSEPGMGTVFKIYLPLADETLARAPAAPPDGLAPGPGGHETILVVDDEAPLREMAERTLQASGYQVLTAASGEQALEIHGGGPRRPDLVVMDLGMPGMGGLKALQALLRAHPGVKVVIASGYAADAQVRQALEAGALGYVAKPFRRAELLKTVRGVLDGGR